MMPSVALGPFKFRSKDEQGDKSDLSDLGGVDKADKVDFPLCVLSVSTHSYACVCLLKHTGPVKK